MIRNPSVFVCLLLACGLAAWTTACRPRDRAPGPAAAKTGNAAAEAPERTSDSGSASSVLGGTSGGDGASDARRGAEETWSGARGTGSSSPASGSTASSSTGDPATYPARFGTRYFPRPAVVYRAPELEEIQVPEIPGRSAIWGAIGRDDQGQIWFGLSTEGGSSNSAHLFRWNPTTGELSEQGSVIPELQRSRLYRDGESQLKIHSRIIQAADGWLYFASMDEQGENARELVLPRWGGHLWRIRPEGGPWEHLLATPEPLIAVGGTGRYVYALGYFHHVLYQYDTQTGEHRSLPVGSRGAHISRNFVVDSFEQAYVPRVAASSDGTSRAWLVQVSPAMEERQAYPLVEYPADPSFDSHGLVGFVHLQDGSVVMSSSSGFLWRVLPDPSGPSRCEELGWFHPSGTSYPASLFTFEGLRYVCGLARLANKEYEWVVRDLETGKSVALPFDVASQQLLQKNGLLLYGTNLRDDLGQAYLVGRWIEDGSQRPVMLQARFWP